MHGSLRVSRFVRTSFQTFTQSKCTKLFFNALFLYIDSNLFQNSLKIYVLLVMNTFFDTFMDVVVKTLFKHNSIILQQFEHGRRSIYLHVFSRFSWKLSKCKNAVRYFQSKPRKSLCVKAFAPTILWTSTSNFTGTSKYFLKTNFNISIKIV